MKVKIGGLDLIKLNMGILEKLMEKHILTGEEVRDVLRSATDPELLKQGKEPYQVTDDSED